MNVVLDTHVWLWWAAAPAKLSADARAAIDASESIGIAAISCWELGMLAAKRRIELDREPARWVRQALAREGVRALALTPELAVRAAALDAGEFPGDPADRMIYATAQSIGATLLTRDRALRAYDPRATLW